MKILITAVAPSLKAEFDPRFGRGAYFISYDTNTKEWESHPNQGVSASGGAGTMAAQYIAAQKVEAVISGDFGPNAYAALNAASVPMFINKIPGTVQSVILRFDAGELEHVSAPTAAGTHHGKGKR